MGVDLKKVKSGDRLRIPAQTFNAFVDAARAHGDSAHDVRRRGAVGRRTGDILIQNKTGGDLDEFSVVGLGDPIFEPTDDETTATFKAQVGFEGETPATADHTGKFAIILEPLAADAIGPARVSGVCPVEIDITDTGHTCADIDNAETGNLNSGVTGAAQILWAETGTGVKWAVVRLGSAEAGMADGTSQNQMWWWDEATGEWKLLTGPDADYKILQRKADDSIGWDYLRFSD